MFEGLKGMAGLAGMMKDLPKLKARMDEIKEELAGVTVDAETGGGAVRVTANGQLRIVAVKVDQALMAGLVDSTDPDDIAMAEDLITGAINAALEKAREAAEQRIGEAASEMGLPIPPGGLGGMLS